MTLTLHITEKPDGGLLVEIPQQQTMGTTKESEAMKTILEVLDGFLTSQPDAIVHQPLNITENPIGNG